MRLPKAYRSLSRPSSLFKPSCPPNRLSILYSPMHGHQMKKHEMNDNPSPKKYFLSCTKKEFDKYNFFKDDEEIF